MARASLNLDQAALHQVGMERARMLVNKVTRQTLNRSAVLCPVDTGRLRASGSVRIAERGSAVVGQVEYTADYAAAVHNGTRPHVIVPRRGRYLRFQVGGRTVYARRVNHPGTPARPYLATALREVAGRAGFTVSIG
jgi:hypothetical protein